VNFMLFVTRWFGVTATDADRDPAREHADIEAIKERSLLVQSKAASQQHRPLARGTHAKGVCARAEFEVFDVTQGRDPALAARLAQGMFAKPGVYPAVVRFGNADSKKNSDFKPDVRSMSFSVDLTQGGAVVPEPGYERQDFSMQNTTTLPINDSPAFLAIVKVLTASNPAAGLWSLSFKDKLRVIRTLTLVQVQSHQTIKPYQQLRYGSNVPFRHGPIEVVKFSASLSPENLARGLQKNNPNGLQYQLARHRLTYWGKRHDAKFWTENASIEWNEAEAPFHKVAQLTFLKGSHLGLEESKAVYFDVTHHSSADSPPVGSINRARAFSEAASRATRLSGAQAD